MIYLFNNVYLKPATNVADTPNMVFISRELSNQLPTDPFLASVFKQEAGVVHQQFNSYDETIAAFGSDDAFFDYLADWDEHKQLVIYADPEAYVAILLKWFKTILINATPTVAYDVVYMTFKRLDYLFSRHQHPQLSTTADDRLVYAAYSRLLPTRDEFSNLWDQSTPCSGKYSREHYAGRCGLEFMIASTLLGTTPDVHQRLEQKIVSMVKKQHVRYMLEVRENVYLHTDMLPNYDFNTQTLADWVATQHAGYGFLTDPNFLPDSLEYIEATYDPAQLHDAFWSIISVNGYTVGSFLHKMLNVFNITTLEEVLRMEVEYTKWRVFLGRWRYSVTTNSYILEFVLERYRNKDVNTLQQLSPL